MVDLARKSATSISADRILSAGSVGDLEARLDEAVVMPSLHDYIWDQGSPLPPWLSLALVERLLHGTRAHLRQIASAPGIAVPDDIVAPHERLDLQALEAEVLADEARAQEWMNAAEASGQDVYFPTDGAEHA